MQYKKIKYFRNFAVFAVNFDKNCAQIFKIVLKNKIIVL